MEVLKFCTKTGVDISLASLDGKWVLSIIGGPLITLDDRSSFRVSIDPFPHAWRVSFCLSDQHVIWFDVDEATALKIEQMVDVG
ncbi:MAG: hypothetical protein KAI85_03525 [Halopseudomonas aestusnigri]|nr:hypothetical protein [Halopseudomonas aestusnigri]